MKKLGVILVFVASLASAQEAKFTLNDCYSSMLETYPLMQQQELNNQVSDLKMKNIQSNWLPKAEFKAQATYQSDAMKVDIEAMGRSFGFESDKDQYKANIDINQMIYDWGRIKASKNLESADLNIKQQLTKVELNKVKEQVNRFYFAILVIESNKELLDVMLKNLEAKESSVNAAVKNGVLLKSDMFSIQAEIIKVKQSIAELNQQEEAARKILSEICGLQISEGDVLETPEYELNYSSEIHRAENRLFNYQREKVNSSVNLIGKQNKPTVFAFSQVGYGKPGLNMVNDEFDSFYIVGLGVNWKIWDWNKTKREKQILTLNSDFISTQEKTFNKQVSVALNNEISQIKIFEEAIKSDLDIIELREEITKSAQSKLDNGVISSTDYIDELSRETQAKISYGTHKIQLIQAKVNYLYLKGEI